MKRGSGEIKRFANKRYPLETWCSEEKQKEWENWKKSGKAYFWY
jgi:hypothetical protein